MVSNLAKIEKRTNEILALVEMQQMNSHAKISDAGVVLEDQKKVEHARSIMGKIFSFQA